MIKLLAVVMLMSSSGAEEKMRTLWTEEDLKSKMKRQCLTEKRHTRVFRSNPGLMRWEQYDAETGEIVTYAVTYGGVMYYNTDRLKLMGDKQFKETLKKIEDKVAEETNSLWDQERRCIEKGVKELTEKCKLCMVGGKCPDECFKG